MAGLFRVRTALTGGSGGPQLSTMYFEDTGTFNAQNAADAVHAWWNSVKSVMSSSYSIQVEPLVVSIDPATGQPTSSHGVTTVSVNGTNGTAPLPWSTHAVAQWHTGLYVTGRELRGHTFIPGCTEGNNVAGVPDAALVAAVNAANATLIGTITANLVVYSRTKHTWNQVNTGTTWNKWGYLSSRRD